MTGFLHKLFGKSPAAGRSSGAAPSDAEADSSVRADERIEDLYEEFRATFCFRPDTNLLHYLNANGMTRMIQWLHWSTPEPEPKAIIRLAVGSTRRGEHIWKKKGISLFHDGSWDRGGGPSEETQGALSVLAQMIGKPITVYYREKPEGQVMMKVFEP